MRTSLRWACLILAFTGGLLVQVVRYQSDQLARLQSRVDPHVDVLAELQDELEATRVELAVRNVLDANRINVPANKKRAIANSIIEVGQRYELPPDLILAIIFTESRFDVAAESEKGAIGLMQLMPATASALADELEVEWKGQQLLIDPEINILLGSFYLRQLLHRFNDLSTALAAYNVGPTKLRDLLLKRGHLPQRYSTQVERVRDSLLRDHF